MMVELQLDRAGEWMEKNTTWTSMCVDNGITLTYSSIDSKKANGHPESSIKHMTHGAKAIMLSNCLSPEWYEECANQARIIRNYMPMRRNITSKDGDTLRPLE